MAVKKVVDTMMDLEQKLVTFNMIICNICLCCVYMGVKWILFLAFNQLTVPVENL